MQSMMMKIALTFLLLTGAAWAQPHESATSQQSTVNEDVRDLENAVKIGRKALPIYRKLLTFQRQHLTAVPGRDGQVYDFSNGANGLNSFSREVNARVRGAAAGSEQDVLWVEQFLLPTAEQAIDAGVIRELMELGEYADQLDDQ